MPFCSLQIVHPVYETEHDILIDMWLRSCRFVDALRNLFIPLYLSTVGELYYVTVLAPLRADITLYASPLWGFEVTFVTVRFVRSFLSFLRCFVIVPIGWAFGTFEQFLVKFFRIFFLCFVTDQSFGQFAVLLTETPWAWLTLLSFDLLLSPLAARFRDVSLRLCFKISSMVQSLCLCFDSFIVSS